MAQFPTAFGGALDICAITVEERAKHDQQFLSIKPSGGLITGDMARNFFLQSGLPPPILAQIWAMADLNNDGKMDQLEFSIAMKLIKLKLQGHQLPSVLPPIMLQPPAALPPAGFGIGNVATVGGVAPVPMGPMPVVGMSPPLVSSVSTAGVPSLPNGTPAMIQPLPAFAHPGATLPKSSSFGRSASANQANATKMQKAQSFDMGNANAPPLMASVEWAVPQSSRLKYRQLFNSHDKTMSGYLTGPQARTILMQSSLPQSQLAAIWNLSDIDQDGKLTAEEFILAMHLIDMAMSGQSLPPVLSRELIPPTFRRARSGSGMSSGSSVGSDQKVPEEPPEEEPEKKLPVTFEDKKRENFERGNLELEKRRQALLEQQRKEQERLAQLERAELERKERERMEQERKRQQELERQLEKQRELERHREEERRKEIERREAAKRELERQRQLEWERNRRQELLNQRNKEQEDIVALKARKKTLEFELEALSPNNRNEDLSPLNQTMDPPEENEVFAEADVNQNNGSPSKEKKVVVTDSKDDGEPKNAWKPPNTAEAAARPHLVRLFSRDAPGREDNTFKDRPSESEELQTIQEDSSVSLVSPDLMEEQKLVSQTSTSSEKKGSVTKQMASASTSDHAKQAGGSHSRQRDSSLLGKLFGQEGSKRPDKGKDSLTKTVQAALTIHKPQPARKTDDNAVVHFFKNVMSPKRAPPKGADGQRPTGHGASGRMLDASKSKESFRGHKDGSGTLSKIFKLGKKEGEGSHSRR